MMRRTNSLPAAVWILAAALAATTAAADEKPEDEAVKQAESETVVKAVLDEAVQVEGKKEKPPSGWKEVRRAGVLYWCRKTPPTGSRVRTELECATPAQYKERSRTDRSNAEELIRNAPGPKGG
jgi:hypothetical protein